MSEQPKKIWGPGTWHSIHTTAAWVDSMDKFKFFCTWIRDQLDKLPCPECTQHAQEYLMNYPPERTEDVFIWSWRFHNAVNQKLGKPELNYDGAKKLYLDPKSKTCTGSCA